MGAYALADSLLVKDKGLQAMHDSVVAYMAAQRSGTASTLNKGEVAGSNKKPWRQKGLGRARAGYRQSPVWRGGGVAFGPRPRSYRKKMTKKAARLGFCRAFSEKVAANEVIVLDELKLASAKTKDFAVMLKKLGAENGALVLMDRVEENVRRASGNIPRVEVCEARNVNTYQLLRYPVIVATKSGMAELEKRLATDAGSDA
ncbi:MAG: 50S ribosomal protein L4 [Kiritimatiellia bacterium]